jgi:hypothetical protein
LEQGGLAPEVYDTPDLEVPARSKLRTARLWRPAMAKKSKEYDELLNSVEDLIKESEAASTRSREKELAFLKLLTEDTSVTPRKGSNSSMTGPKTPKEKPIYKGLREYTRRNTRDWSRRDRSLS